MVPGMKAPVLWYRVALCTRELPSQGVGLKVFDGWLMLVLKPCCFLAEGFEGCP